MKNITRREFLKAAGVGAAGLAIGCKSGNVVSAEGGQIGEVPTDKMTYRTNQHTGDVVSLLGYGCMRWPMTEDGSAIDQELVNELVDYALAHGVNYFDTAPVYIRGWSEAATGRALARHPRESYFVATKASGGPGPIENGIAMYRRSLEALQVDYLDYYLLHNVGGSIESFHARFIDNGLLDFFIEEKRAGRIRNLGWSFHGRREVFDYVLAYRDIQWDFCQIQLNYQDWRNAQEGRNVDAEYLYAELEKKNVPSIIMEPLLGGRLARVPAQAMEMMQAVRPFDTAAQWAFRYAGTPSGVLTVLSGMTYMEHLQENIRTYAPLEPLTDGERELLEGPVTEVLVDSDYIQCTTCQYCMPCPYGIDIPSTFAHYNRCITDGNIAKDVRDENYRKARRAFLIGYDRSVPKLRQANHCINCNQCLPNCPQKLNIPEEMYKIDNYVEQLKING